jgi:hypothetical protein
VALEAVEAKVTVEPLVLVLPDVLPEALLDNDPQTDSKNGNSSQEDQLKSFCSGVAM